MLAAFTEKGIPAEAQGRRDFFPFLSSAPPRGNPPVLFRHHHEGAFALAQRLPQSTDIAVGFGVVPAVLSLVFHHEDAPSVGDLSARPPPPLPERPKKNTPKRTAQVSR